MNPIDLLSAGYDDLICVSAPGGTIHKDSELRAQDMGKVPAKCNPFDEWYGYNWRAEPKPSHARVQSWLDDGANIGLKATNFPAVDIDVTNTSLANLIQRLAGQHLGLAPVRVGRAPKRLMIYKTTEPFRRMRLWIKQGDEKHLIEVLGDGQQYVVAGTHPVTGKPYSWTQEPFNVEYLTEITHDDVEAFFTLVEDAVDLFGYECEREGSGALARDRQEIDQRALTGDAQKVSAALSYLPNTNDLFPGRDDYLRVGYAIKAALGDEGYSHFETWALEWEGNGHADPNTPESVWSDWQRMQPPFEVGANWLYEKAQLNGWDWAAEEFEADSSLSAEDGPHEEGSGVLSDAAFAAAVAAQTIPGDAERKAERIKFAGEYTDRDLTMKFVKAYREEVRYCEEMGKWLAWDGQRWNRAGDNAVHYRVGELLEDACQEASMTIESTKECKATVAMLGSNAKRNNVVAYAKVMPALAVDVEALDTQDHLLNTPAGVVDLRTGLMSPHDPTLLLTKVSAVAPEAGKPKRWLQFLHEATGGDKQMIEYLQRVAGYALTGDKSLHSLHFFYGPGGNGKGTFLNTLRDVWGEYAKTADMSIFVSQKFEQHSTGLADLAGARLVLAQETDDSRMWDEAKLKQLTSADPVKARFMQKDFFEFKPKFKLLFAGNHRPGIRNVDDALRRRIHIVPFTRKPETPDIDLPLKLLEEFGQILQWAIEGAMKFYAEKSLRDPDVVHEATNEYFDDEDDFGQWLMERTVEDKNAFSLTRDLVDDYQQWAASGNGQRRGPKTIAALLGDKGFKRGRVDGRGARGFIGIRLTRTPGDEFGTDPDLSGV
jgi:P4 family phage/plasmid primase-like protien